MSMIDRLQTGFQKRRQFNRTRRELRAMPLDVALDLDMAREDADLMARQAVYGR
ncbi:hypothetical protein SAMN04490244_106288 [Tranquillimonas rosea]|uniref:DUF1127 domain-containing protein n=1 Tax=Tranquillimonas rosea TaxID=641238 RepID=A0A1H9V6I3_9RHOB|nr:hypothetical protein [Tranquillimonas rosea]SES17366.1 hypothetical protein SAMN04490244_106288 [Tranquillimonas rosea]